MEMKLEILGREVIKPASPSPQDFLQLSLADVYGPATYVSTIFFFKSVSGESREIISGRLKTSLSQTLSRFYPLAGRMEGHKIICNDEGAVFTEARTDLLLSDFLKNNTNSLPEFLPTIAPGESAGTWPLLSVKVNFFGSGSGFAVTVFVSHRICDAASVLTFVSGWAATAKAKSNDVAMNIPTFATTTIYPPPPSSFQSSSMDGLYEVGSKCVTNRFLFKSSKIAELKRKATSETVPVPTRVEAIMSLMWRCATISTRSNSAVPKSTLMIQPMDLRLRLPSAVLPKDAVGNLQASFFLKKDSESEMDIAEFVDEFRKAKEGVNEMIRENLATNITATTLGLNLLSHMGKLVSELKPDTDVYPMSSWCRKPFYEVDFGCGCPVWIGFTGHIMETTAFVLLIDSKDGEDVEAWISLPEQDMSVFVRDQDVLAYAIMIIHFQNFIPWFLLENGNLEGAKKLFDQLTSKGLPDLVTYHILMGGYCCRGESRKAARLLKEGISKVGLKPRHLTYNILMEGYSKEGNLKGAANVRIQMEKERWLRMNVASYNVLLQGYAQKGKMEDANKLLNEMLEKGLIPNRITYEIVKAEMVDKGFVPDIEWHLFNVSTKA
ncbi:hypothetical protein Bca101_066018 [Brassica carinata]